MLLLNGPMPSSFVPLVLFIPSPLISGASRRNRELQLFSGEEGRTQRVRHQFVLTVDLRIAAT
jgi:hypothetical protein